MSHPALISVDWGTSTLRGSLLATDGTIIARSAEGPGVQPKPADGFEPVLAELTAAWRKDYGPLPVIMSGMIGSRQGWHEIPYLACPVTVSDLATHLHTIDSAPIGRIHIVPGLVLAPSGQPPEVMRGEETQILGALAADPALPGASARMFVLPGTHSKWVWTADGTIVKFATYMTGEIFAALRYHTILGRLMPDGPSMFDRSAFDRGVVAGAADGPPGALLNRVFATRTLGLFDAIAPHGLESYLSGVLIGAELAAATGIDKHRAITIIGNSQLSQSYHTAARLLRIDARLASPDCAARGHFAIAQNAGLLKATPP